MNFNKTECSLLPAAFWDFVSRCYSELCAVYHNHELKKELSFDEFALAVYDEMN